jgi:hypothetical protein
VEGASVKRINAQYFYQLAAAILPLKQLKPTPLIESFSELWTAEQFLLGYLTNDLTRPTASANSGWELLRAIQALTNNLMREEPISYLEATNISGVMLQKFENNLEAEYNSKDVFVVSRKGIFSTTDLIEGAELLFSKDVQARIQSAVPDIQQAGKCIAFEVPTAAAFHIFRAVEAVSKLYVEKMRGRGPTDKEKRGGIGSFVAILDANGADPRVTSSLAQLAKLHRNPTMHPDMTISNDEVLATLGMAQSVIQSMVADMEKKDASPLPNIVEVLPNVRAVKPLGSAGNGGGSRNRTLRLGDGTDSKSAPSATKRGTRARKKESEKTASV